MVELWAVIGRACLDKRFADQLRTCVDPKKRFEELTDLRQCLIVDQQLRLSRWELVQVNHMFTNTESVGEEPNPGGFELVKQARGNWDLPMEFRRDVELCASIGLATIDSRYRASLSRQLSAESPADQLKTLLTQGGNNGHLPESPMFDLGTAELFTLRQFLSREGTLKALGRFGFFEWEQYRIVCDTGFRSRPAVVKPIEAMPSGHAIKSQGIFEEPDEYVFLPQQDLAKLLRDNRQVGAILKTLLR